LLLHVFCQGSGRQGRVLRWENAHG
jgi:hypothetical protein